MTSGLGRPTVTCLRGRLSRDKAHRIRALTTHFQQVGCRYVQGMREKEAEQAGVQIPQTAIDEQRKHDKQDDGNDDTVNGQLAHCHALLESMRVLQAPVGERKLALEAIDGVDKGKRAGKDQGDDPIWSVGCKQLKSAS